MRQPTGEKAPKSSGASTPGLVDELPVSRSAWMLRVILVLLVDAALAGTGGFLIWRWLNAPIATAPEPSSPAAPTLAPSPRTPPAAPLAAPPRRANPKPVAGRSVDNAAKPMTAPDGPSGMQNSTTEPAPVGAGEPQPSPPAAIVALPDAAVASEPEPTVDEGPAVGLMTAGIRQVVEAHREPIGDCYRRAAKAWDGEAPLAGRLQVHLRILAEGDAEDVRVVENHTGSTELGACLVALMRSWHYPAPGTAMEFHWPFTFQGSR